MLLTCGYQDKETHCPLKPPCLPPASPSPWCLGAEDTPRLKEWERMVCLGPMSTRPCSVLGLMSVLTPTCVWGTVPGSAALHMPECWHSPSHPSCPVSVLRSLGSREVRNAKSCSTEGF